MFAIINIVIVIIAGKSNAGTWSWLRDDPSQFYLVSFSNASGGKYSVVQGRSMAFFLSLPSDSRFPYCRQQSTTMIITWDKLWQRDRINIIGLREWYRLKSLTLNRTCWSNCSPFLKFSTIFFKCIKTPTEKCTFPTTKNILDFLFLLYQI